MLPDQATWSRYTIRLQEHSMQLKAVGLLLDNSWLEELRPSIVYPKAIWQTEFVYILSDLYIYWVVCIFIEWFVCILSDAMMRCNLVVYFFLFETYSPKARAFRAHWPSTRKNVLPYYHRMGDGQAPSMHHQVLWGSGDFYCYQFYGIRTLMKSWC